VPATGEEIVSNPITSSEDPRLWKRNPDTPSQSPPKAELPGEAMTLYVIPTEDGANRAQIHGARPATASEVLAAARDLLSPPDAWAVSDV